MYERTRAGCAFLFFFFFFSRSVLFVFSFPAKFGLCYGQFRGGDRIWKFLFLAKGQRGVGPVCERIFI